MWAEVSGFEHDKALTLGRAMPGPKAHSKRWGQLNNNDYSEPQAFVMRPSADKKWLQDYLKLFYYEKKFEDMLPFIPNEAFSDFVDRIKALAVRDKHASAVADFLHRIREEREKKKNSQVLTQAERN